MWVSHGAGPLQSGDVLGTFVRSERILDARHARHSRHSREHAVDLIGEDGAAQTYGVTEYLNA
jgi:hypothetical protein